MRPRVARICEDICTAWAKSPVISERAATKRLPKLWPSRSPWSKRYWKRLGEQVLILGEGDHAVADVAGGKHLEVFAETAGGAAVVGDGDDGGEVADEAGQVGGLGTAIGADGRAGCGRGYGGGSSAAGDVGGAAGGGGSGDVALEAAQQSGEAGASADGDDAERAVAEFGGRGLRKRDVGFRCWGMEASARIEGIRFDATEMARTGANTLHLAGREMGQIEPTTRLVRRTTAALRLR